MTENNDNQIKAESPKALPPPEEKKKIFQINIDLEKLAEPHKCNVPENQIVWQSKKEMSKEYLELNKELQILALYIAKCCNEGPEVKDNINKRLVLARIVFGIILDNLAVTGYDAYGMLLEMLQDTYMKISGKRIILDTIAQISQAQEQYSQGKSQDYTS
jgi:hypothetical protein